MKRSTSITLASTFATTLVLTLASPTLFAAPGSAAAQSTNASEHKPAVDAASDIQNLALAARLAQYGDENGNPTALLLAAEIKKTTPLKPVEREKLAASEDESAVALEPKATGTVYTVDDLLDRARELAVESQYFMDMADTIASIESRGFIDGPQYHRDQVLANRVDVYELTFVGDEPAEVLVIGDGDTDLDLYIYDENGNAICEDSDMTDTMICTWNPRWTGEFRVEIHNLGGVYNAYEMLTN